MWTQLRLLGPEAAAPLISRPGQYDLAGDRVRPRSCRAPVDTSAPGFAEVACRLFAAACCFRALAGNRDCSGYPLRNRERQGAGGRHGPAVAPKSHPEIQARSPPADAPAPDQRSEPRSNAWAQSRVILSSRELADPRNRKTVETLKRLEPQTRSQQLCDFEAILQINRQFQRIRRRFRHCLCNRSGGSKRRRRHRSRRSVSQQRPMVQARLRMPAVNQPARRRSPQIQDRRCDTRRPMGRSQSPESAEQSARAATDARRGGAAILYSGAQYSGSVLDHHSPERPQTSLPTVV